jgi:DNA-binding MarR family transcriptional regulator
MFLTHCNRYSNTPIGVTEYLGATKGTISQTLLLLQTKGLIQAAPDERDRRKTHLELTQSGHEVLGSVVPPQLLKRALGKIHTNGTKVEDVLTELLSHLQAAHGARTFGVCRTCRHLRHEDGGATRCGLTSEPLAEHETHLSCREHATRLASSDG